MVDIFKGKTLIGKDGRQHSADAVLGGKKLVCLYFAAQWCPASRMFTPVLANFYEDAKKGNLSIEVIFISGDRTPYDMLRYMRSSHGNWYGLPFDDPLQSEIEERYKVPGVPTLLVLRPDGTVVNHNGKRLLQERGVRAFRDWLCS